MKKTTTIIWLSLLGKTDDIGRIMAGQKDDATMAFIMNAYFSHIIIANGET